MILTVAKITKERKEAKQGKVKIRVGYLVIEKFGDMYNNTMKGNIRRMSKEPVGCVQA